MQNHMKTKLFFTLILLLAGISAMKAQYVNNVPISELDVDYVVLWSDNGPFLSSKITVRLDYGQGGRIPQIQDDRRRVISFNGMVSAINMMSRNGFELDRIMRDSKDSKDSNDYYYFKRRNLSSIGSTSSEGTVDYNSITHSK